MYPPLVLCGARCCCRYRRPGSGVQPQYTEGVTRKYSLTQKAGGVIILTKEGEAYAI